MCQQLQTGYPNRVTGTASRLHQCLTPVPKPNRHIRNDSNLSARGAKIVCTLMMMIWWIQRGDRASEPCSDASLDHQCSSLHCPFQYWADAEGELGLVGLRVYEARNAILENKPFIRMSSWVASPLGRDSRVFFISKPLLQVGRACAPPAYF